MLLERRKQWRAELALADAKGRLAAAEKKSSIRTGLLKGGGPVEGSVIIADGLQERRLSDLSLAENPYDGAVRQGVGNARAERAGSLVRVATSIWSLASSAYR
jgi:hypothetical protein